MSAAAAAANAVVLAACLIETAAFKDALRHPAPVQEAALRRILGSNSDTAFGREHGLAAVRTPREFASAVPMASWEDLEPWIERAAAGEDGVLTREPVVLFEPTGGSAGGSKLMPVTASLKLEFRRAVAPWIADLYAARPGLLAGSAYWSVSPSGRREQRTSGGTPIGFDSDEEYVGGAFASLLRASMAAPSSLALLESVSAFRYATLLFLLRSRDLSFVSVWNPTFLSLLLDELDRAGDALVADLRDGSLRGAPPAATPDVSALLRPDPVRAAEVAQALAESDPADRHARLWPRLTVLSCWADGHAEPYARSLARLLPQAHLQPKGLLATEACFTIPLSGAPAPVPALRSHYFEFAPEEGGEPVGLEAVEEGRRYRVVVTTGGGLYRYRIGDVVVGGPTWRATPTLCFAGRVASISDRFGEKLEEGHVAAVLRRVLSRRGVSDVFAMMAFEACSGAYALYLEAEMPGDCASAVAGDLDAELAENPGYAYCRRLGQLAPVVVVPVRGGTEAYISACVARGQRAGDVKPVALHSADDWGAVFGGGGRAA